MPKKTTNVLETKFTVNDRFSKNIGRMSRGLAFMNRVADRTKRAMRATGRAILFAGRASIKVARTGFYMLSGAALSVAGAIYKVSKSFSMIEDAQAQFTPLMGSVIEAEKLVSALNKTAASTPFQFETLSDTVKQLLPSMNGSIENTIKLTRMLGDTAGGNAQKMDSITRGYNKSLIKGKVDLESLNMIAEAGVPIFQQLAAQMNVSMPKLFKNITAGKVKVSDLTSTFERMTSKGGIFFGGMEIASQTLSGKISTLKDNVNLAAAEFGRALSPTMKAAADIATKYAEQIRKWAAANQGLIKQKIDYYLKKIYEAGKKAFQWVKDNKKDIKEFARDIFSLGSAIFSVTKFVWKNKYAIIGLMASYRAFGAFLRVSKWATTLEETAKAARNATLAASAMSTSLTNGVLQPLSKQELLNQKMVKFSKIVGVGGMVISAFAAGWEVGTLIFDKWFASLDILAEKAGNVAAAMGINAPKMTDNELDTNQKKMATQQKKLEIGKGEAIAAAFNPLMAFRTAYKYVTNRDALKNTRQAQIDILQEKKRRMESNVAPVGKSSTEMDSASTVPVDRVPQVQVQRMESMKTEKTEIVIRDETGRAEVTKGRSSKGLTLLKTGAP